MNIGILKEEKKPADKRVPFTPNQCLEIVKRFPNIKIFVQSSNIRCFADSEYLNKGIEVVKDISFCDILMGIKEVPVERLIAKKTYMFFSHTIKKQEYNKDLLVKMIDLHIRMIDYEALRGLDNKRLLGFGRYAGIVGAYNTLLAYGIKSKKYSIKPAYLCQNRLEMEKYLEEVNLGNEKILVTGSGRVGGGVIELLNKAGINKITKDEFVNKSFSGPVFVQLDTMDYNVRKDNSISKKSDFYSNPDLYESSFLKYAKHADIYIAGHYHSQKSPKIFTAQNARECKIKVIGDISCDIKGPIASTIRSSTIKNPIYGYNPITSEEDDYQKDEVIAVMAVDNLPCELPIDASYDFGKALIDKVLPILTDNKNQIIKRSTICEKGRLTSYFDYLKDYVGNI